MAQLPSESKLTLEPGADTREALARHVGALSVPALKVTLTLAVDRNGDVDVEGRLTGRVVQPCVVTLEPIEAELDEDVAVRFSADARPLEVEPGTEIEFSAEEADPPEPIVDGRFDLGAILTEFFSLSVEPYPRKPDVAWQSPADDEGNNSPFAALVKLKPSGPS
ncbi:hypothetical protein BV133_2550 [Blastochloris viridis]|uniref:Putative ACR n=1 Tax=Blastochloris viridis TaxID=1079 RepID=A0A0H5BQ03_BLAVI|nr:hypothetical protein BV133_2550 [Blastochloris viridis]CUU42610.1 putative ACR_ [Blastochloris viridis]